MQSDNPDVSYDPYNIHKDEPIDTKNPKSNPPVINRPKDEQEEDVFHKALAKMHNCKQTDIQIVIKGHWKEYQINGKLIFKDRA